MKPIKLLACLVALQTVGCLHLKAFDKQDFRDWTDLQGRKISARLLELVESHSIRIERNDGAVFVVALKNFCEADRLYVSELKTGESGQAALKDVDPDTWSLLKQARSQPASTYTDTPLSEIIESINRRLIEEKLLKSNGQPLQIRGEPAELAKDLKITGSLPSMSTADFLKRLTYNNNLVVKMDAAGGVVLVDKNAGPRAKFFGVDAY